MRSRFDAFIRKVLLENSPEFSTYRDRETPNQNFTDREAFDMNYTDVGSITFGMVEDGRVFSLQSKKNPKYQGVTHHHLGRMVRMYKQDKLPYHKFKKSGRAWLRNNKLFITFWTSSEAQGMNPDELKVLVDHLKERYKINPEEILVSLGGKFKPIGQDNFLTKEEQRLHDLERQYHLATPQLKKFLRNGIEDMRRKMREERLGDY